MRTRLINLSFIAAILPLWLQMGCATAKVDKVDVADPNFFPMEKGTYWVYETNSEEQEGGADEAGNIKTNKRHTIDRIEVLDSCERRGVAAALLSDFLWSGVFDQKRVLLRSSLGRYYLLPAIKWEEISGKIKDPNDILAGIEDGEQIIDAPFAVGRTFGDGEAESRTDHWYCWCVESYDRKHFRNIKGVLPNKSYDAFTLFFRTNPDHQKIVFVPGVGITSYEYVHHGTVIEVHSFLKEFGHRKKE